MVKRAAVTEHDHPTTCSFGGTPGPDRRSAWILLDNVCGACHLRPSRRGRTAAPGHGTFVDDVVRPAWSPVSCAARWHVRIVGIDISAAGAAGCGCCPSPRISTPMSVSCVLDRGGRPTPQWPPMAGARCFVGDLSPGIAGRYVAEDAAEPSMSRTPPPVVDCQAQQSTDSSTRHMRATSPVGSTARSRWRSKGVRAGRARRDRDDLPGRHKSPFRWSALSWVVSGELTMGRDRWRRKYAFISRLLGRPASHPRDRRATPAAAGQKTVPMRGRCALILQQVPAPVKWVEDRRENLWPRRRHGTATCGWRSTRRQ
jgi:carbon-monoxide dehydrogenase large subunit